MTLAALTPAEPTASPGRLKCCPTHHFSRARFKWRSIELLSPPLMANWSGAPFVTAAAPANLPEAASRLAARTAMKESTCQALRH